ncbi:MAG: right-handed parallel beta-helix repeat-containing protein [Planctomycetota bacterium]
MRGCDKRGVGCSRWVGLLAVLVCLGQPAYGQANDPEPPTPKEVADALRELRDWANAERSARFAAEGQSPAWREAQRLRDILALAVRTADDYAKRGPLGDGADTPAPLPDPEPITIEPYYDATDNAALAPLPGLRLIPEHTLGVTDDGFDPDLVRARARAAPVGELTVINAERWPLSGDAFEASLEKYRQLLTLYRSAMPDGAAVGLYSLLPERNYWAPVLGRENELAAWRARNDRIAEVLGPLVDVVVPSLYCFYTDADKAGVAGRAHAEWLAYAAANLAEARRVAPGKPVVPFVWPLIHDSNAAHGGTPIGEERWAAVLSYARDNADGVAIWGWRLDTSGRPGWLQATQKVVGVELNALPPPNVANPTTPTAYNPADGWLPLAPSADSRVVFVSSSGGDDANDGLSADRPVRSVGKGLSLLRDGFPDWLLFKRGDVWTQGLGNWTRSGRSADAPMVVGLYGNTDQPRPRFNLGGGFLSIFNKGQGVTRWVVFRGLHINCEARRPDRPGFGPTDAKNNPTGINVVAHFEGIVLEDVVVEHYKDGIVFNPTRRINGELDETYRGTGLTIRRCIVRNNYATWQDGNSGKSQGLYIDLVDDYVIEDSTFYRNGWHPDVERADRNRFNHNIYINSRAGSGVVRRNILASAGSHGAQMRGGGVFEDNLVIDSPLAAFVTARDSTMRNNVVLLSPEVTTDDRQNDGVGLQAFNLASVEITGNVIGHLARDGDGSPIEARDNVGSAVVRDNVVTLWPGSVRLRDGATQSGNRFGLSIDLGVGDRFDLADFPEIEASINRGPGVYDPSRHGPDPINARIREALN